MSKLSILLLLLAASLSAQYMPTRQQRQRNTASNKRSDSPSELLFKFDGSIKESSKKEFVVEVEGDQTLTFRRAKDIKILNDKGAAKDKSLPVGTKVSVEAKREMNGDLTAMIVHLTPSPKVQ
jgi:hypothetical protein